MSLHCEISEPHFIAEHCSKSNENDYQIGIYFRLYHFFFGYSLKYDENEYPIGTSFGLDYTGAVRPCSPNNSTQTRASNNTHQTGLPSLRHMANADAAVYRGSCMDRDIPRNADNIAAITIIGKEYKKKMDIERYLFEQKNYKTVLSDSSRFGKHFPANQNFVQRGQIIPLDTVLQVLYKIFEFIHRLCA